jgi:hypothetical protein
MEEISKIRLKHCLEDSFIFNGQNYYIIVVKFYKKPTYIHIPFSFTNYNQSISQSSLCFYQKFSQMFGIFSNLLRLFVIFCPKSSAKCWQNLTQKLYITLTPGPGTCGRQAGEDGRDLRQVLGRRRRHGKNFISGQILILPFWKKLSLKLKTQ